MREADDPFQRNSECEWDKVEEERGISQGVERCG